MMKIVYTITVKSGLSKEMYDDLYKMVESLKTEIEHCSNFTVSWGPKDYKSQELNLHINGDIHISNPNVSEGKLISDIVIRSIKKNIKLIKVIESHVISDFALSKDEQEMRNDEGCYKYTLDELLH